MMPTAELVEVCTGVPFVKEAGVGYVNIEHRVVIAKSCAGVNFLIMAFCMVAFTLIGRAGAGGRPFLMAAAALAAAYAATVIVNGARIMIALRHAGDGSGGGWLTPEQVDRLEGIVVYFVALTGLHRLSLGSSCEACGGDSSTSSVEHRTSSRLGRSPIIFVPLGWYAAMTLGVPLLNGAMRTDTAQFGEHALWVLCVPLVLSGILLLVSSGCARR